MSPPLTIPSADPHNAFALVYEQYCEEAAFLWHLRNKTIDAPHYCFEDLIELDERLDAQLKGLYLSGQTGWQVAWDTWQAFNEPGEWFVFMCQSLHLLTCEPLKSNLKAANNLFNSITDEYDKSPTIEKKQAMRNALQWSKDEQVDLFVKYLQASPAPNHQILALEIIADQQSLEDQRKNLISQVNQLLTEVSAQHQRDLLSLIADNKWMDCLPGVIHLVKNTEDLSVKFSAAEALAQLEPQHAVDYLYSIAIDTTNPDQVKALNIWSRLVGLSESSKLLKQWQQGVEQTSLVLALCAARACPADIPLLFTLMENPSLARAAAQTFSLITGLDLFTETEYTQAAPESYLQQIAAEDEDPYWVEDELYAECPWPHINKLQEWWQTQKNKFEAQVVYLCGSPLNPQQCIQVLETGYQQQRLFALQHLQHHQPVSFDLRWPSAKQKRNVPCCN